MWRYLSRHLLALSATGQRQKVRIKVHRDIFFDNFTIITVLKPRLCWGKLFKISQSFILQAFLLKFKRYMDSYRQDIFHSISPSGWQPTNLSLQRGPKDTNTLLRSIPGKLTPSFPTGFMSEGKDQMERTLLPSLPSARLLISALQRVMKLRVSIPSIRFRERGIDQM